MTNNLFQPGALCFDIGALRGESVERFSAAGAGVIVSVEPSVWNYVELLKMRSKYPACIQVPAACGREFGITDVTLAIDIPGLTSCAVEHWKGAYPDVRWGAPQPVPVIPLWYLIQKYGMPDFCKIDVEGQEREVLLGLQASNIPKILTYEFHNAFPDEAMDCLKLCVNLGYQRFCFTDNDLDLEKLPNLNANSLEQMFRAEKPKWGNIVASV